MSAWFYILCVTQCYCGLATDDPDSLGDATCDVDCVGDSSQICGGNSAISVYEYI